MRKKIILLFLIFNFFVFAFAKKETIKGNVVYDETLARIEAFSGIEEKISADVFKNFIKDENKKTNIKAIKNKTYQLQDRNINPFFKWNIMLCYSVSYDDDINKTYYYDYTGNLIKYEINEFEGEYPYRTMAYDKKGNLLNINFVVSEKESYLFDKNKELIGKWEDNQYYDKNDKPILKRELE